MAISIFLNINLRQLKILKYIVETNLGRPNKDLNSDKGDDFKVLDNFNKLNGISIRHIYTMSYNS